MRRMKWKWTERAQQKVVMINTNDDEDCKNKRKHPSKRDSLSLCHSRSMRTHQMLSSLTIIITNILLSSLNVCWCGFISFLYFSLINVNRVSFGPGLFAKITKEFRMQIFFNDLLPFLFPFHIFHCHIYKLAYCISNLTTISFIQNTAVCQ